MEWLGVRGAVSETTGGEGRGGEERHTHVDGKSLAGLKVQSSGESKGSQISPVLVFNTIILWLDTQQAKASQHTGCLRWREQRSAAKPNQKQAPFKISKDNYTFLEEHTACSPLACRAVLGFARVAS